MDLGWLSDPTIATCPTAPNVVSSPQATESSSGYPTITWVDNPTNTIGYYVLRSTSPSGPYSTLNASMLSSTTDSYTDFTAKSGTVYYYEVEAVNYGTTDAISQPIMIGSSSCSSTSTINYVATLQIKAFQFTTSTITAGTNVSIASGRVVDFWASTEVRLLSGFSAKSGCTFQAKIEDCVSSTKSIELDTITNNSITEVQESDTALTIKVYPNPTTGLLTIETGEDEATIGVFNIYGSLLKQQQLQGSVNQMDIVNFEPGTYIIKIITGSGQQKSQLIIKN